MSAPAPAVSKDIAHLGDVCQGVVGESDGTDIAALQKKLVVELRSHGWLVHENIVRPAQHQGRVVSEFTCPIIVGGRIIVIPTDTFPTGEIAMERLHHLCESLNLDGAIMVANSGVIMADAHSKN